MPSGHLIDESASWIVIVVGEVAGYPNSSKHGFGHEVDTRSKVRKRILDILVVDCACDARISIVLLVQDR
jgi:hypothetical protein